jgi:hypothetical protein
MREYFKEEAKKDFKQMMVQLMANPDPDMM